MTELFLVLIATTIVLGGLVVVARLSERLSERLGSWRDVLGGGLLVLLIVYVILGFAYALFANGGSNPGPVPECVGPPSQTC